MTERITIYLILLIVLSFIGCNAFEVEKFVEDRKDSATKLDIDLTGSLQSPSWSPDGDNIVFTHFEEGYSSGKANLVLYSLVTEKTTSLLSDGAINILSPANAWRPDGWITYSSNKSGRFQAYKINPDIGISSITQLTGRQETHSESPALSINGDSLLVQSFPIVPVQGDFIQVEVAPIADSLIYTSVSKPDTNCVFPTWSPTGETIMWGCYYEGTNQDEIVELRVQVMKFVPGVAAPILLLETSTNIPFIDDYSASFTNDGTGIILAFLFDGHSFANLAHFDISSKVITRLTEFNGFDGHGALSADGTKLVFESASTEPLDTDGTTLWLQENVSI